MKKCTITGTSKGLGKAWMDHFGSKADWTVRGFGPSTGYDFLQDLDRVEREVEGSDLFINNTHHQQLQLRLLNRLHTKVKKMIVCGSVAADDLAQLPDEPEYGANKRDLELRTMHLAHDSTEGVCDILYLKLNGDAYQNTQLIMRITDLWLDQPSINMVQFKVSSTR